MKKAFELAKSVRQLAHAPYSNYKVGAVIKAVGRDEYFAGCNVENASYGATICAERSAIVQMVAKLGTTKIDYVLLVIGKDKPVPPCGLCLQVIQEFSDENTRIILATEDKMSEPQPLSTFLPRAFTREDL